MGSNPHIAPPLNEQALRQWDLLAEFRRVLARHTGSKEMASSWSDARRHYSAADYLSLFLFGLFNPGLHTTRALCAASRLPRVQREVSGGRITLGSFSEAQHLLAPALLEKVLAELSGAIQSPPATAQAWQQWFARDSSLFAALPRMRWALYGGGKAGAKNHAVRLHVNLHLLADKPDRMQVTLGKVCERQAWKESWAKGHAYVGDRYFGEHYRLLGELEQAGCRYVLRLREEALIQVAEELTVTEADQKAGVERQAWAHLGCRQRRSVRVRVVWMGTAAGATLRLVTNVPSEALSAEEVGLLYRRRGQIECFFRWVKCLLGCRHWLAESQTGVTLQLYLALIAAVLFQRHTGRRPNQRMLELFQLHQLGWASTEALIAGLQREQAQEDRRKAKNK